MSDVKVRIGADASEFKRVMGEVKSEISATRNLIGGLAGAAATIYGLTKAFQVLGGVLQSTSQAAAGMETLQVSFETLTGSSETAAQMMKTFREEAAKSPLSAADYANAAKTLMSFGMATGDVLPSLKMLGDVSMGNSERFGSLALAFAQTTASGRLMGQEVLQFVNAGFNPLQQISKKTGESMLQLKKRMEDGGVSAQEVAEAFRDATSKGGLFFQAIQRGADTMDGKIAQFQDTVLGLRVAFGEGLNEGLKDALDKAGGELSKFEQVAQQFGNIVGDALSQAVAGNTQKIEQVGGIIMHSILVGMKNFAVAHMAWAMENTVNAWHDFTENNRKLIGLDPKSGMFQRPERVGPVNLFAGAIEDTKKTVSEGVNNAFPQFGTPFVPSPLQQTSSDFNAGIDEGYRAMMERQTRATEELRDFIKQQARDFN